MTFSMVRATAQSVSWVRIPLYKTWVPVLQIGSVSRSRLACKRTLAAKRRKCYKQRSRHRLIVTAAGLVKIAQATINKQLTSNHKLCLLWLIHTIHSATECKGAQKSVTNLIARMTAISTDVFTHMTQDWTNPVVDKCHDGRGFTFNVDVGGKSGNIAARVAHSHILVSIPPYVTLLRNDVTLVVTNKSSLFQCFCHF
jgi:hypothetical protein